MRLRETQLLPHGRKERSRKTGFPTPLFSIFVLVCYLCLCTGKLGCYSTTHHPSLRGGLLLWLLLLRLLLLHQLLLQHGELLLEAFILVQETIGGLVDFVHGGHQHLIELFALFEQFLVLGDLLFDRSELLLHLLILCFQLLVLFGVLLAIQFVEFPADFALAFDFLLKIGRLGQHLVADHILEILAGVDDVVAFESHFLNGDQLLGDLLQLCLKLLELLLDVLTRLLRLGFGLRLSGLGRRLAFGSGLLRQQNGTG